MEWSLDTSINKAEWKCKAQKGCHVFWTKSDRKNESTKDERAADHRITQQLSMEGTSENHPVPIATQSRLS